MGRVLQFSDVHFGCEHKKAVAAALEYAHATPNDLVLITGDITQVDLPRGTKSGLAHVIEVLKDVNGISFTHFKPKDVVRHPLVQRIVEAYESFEDRQSPASKRAAQDAAGD